MINSCGSVHYISNYFKTSSSFSNIPGEESTNLIVLWSGKDCQDYKHTCAHLPSGVNLPCTDLNCVISYIVNRDAIK